MTKAKIKIYFSKGNVGKPITYELVKKYDVMFNILHADINYGSEGNLITEISGEEKNVADALKYLDELDVKYKMYTKSIIRDEDACIDCGSCTSVCPSGALTMNDNDELQFDKEKCLVCELCIKACPIGIIKVEL
ncbi:MAG: 4Fe-4S binding protein [Clostridia bacterium]|nr:4Fe-4S binding protein [Clostridia bacterium]